MEYFYEFRSLVSNEESKESFDSFHDDLRKSIYNCCHTKSGSEANRNEKCDRYVLKFYTVCWLTYFFKVQNMFDDSRLIIITYLTGNLCDMPQYKHRLNGKCQQYCQHLVIKKNKGRKRKRGE